MTLHLPSDSIYHPLVPPASSPAVATTRLVIRNYSRDGKARFSKRMDRPDGWWSYIAAGIYLSHEARRYVLTLREFFMDKWRSHAKSKVQGANVMSVSQINLSPAPTCRTRDMKRLLILIRLILIHRCSCDTRQWYSLLERNVTLWGVTRQKVFCDLYKRRRGKRRKHTWDCKIQ